MKSNKYSKKLISTLMVLTMVLISVTYAVPPKQVNAAVDSEKLAATYLNETSKYLHLGDRNADTYNFNINKSAKEKGATYSWYVKSDKGNPASVTIDKKTGVVTAKESGTAYIGCEVTLKNGTICRPEAKVIVRNNITEIRISNQLENMTLTAGKAYDFNRTVLNTEAGKGMKTEGITRWEISEDTAGVESANEKGIVFPTKAGEFKIRAVSFQSKEKYKLWIEDKEANDEYVTAASEWQTVMVVSSNGKAIANTQEQLNKALATDDLVEISLSTKKAETFVIEEGEYTSKSLLVDTPNADVKNYGKFNNITINAIKDTTWIEYANGNIIYLLDSQLSFVIDSGAEIKQIVIDTPNSMINFEIRGKVDKITVLQPSRINLSGDSANIPITVEKNAGGSTISSSVPLNLTLEADVDVELSKGAEESSIDKSVTSVEVKVENNSTKAVVITTNKRGGETIKSGENGTSNETTASTPPPTPSTDGGGSNTPTDTTVEVTGVSVSIATMTLVVGGASQTIVATVIPSNASNKEISWSSNNTSVATVVNGVVTPVAAGTATITATTTNNMKTATCLVTVTTIPELNVAVESVAISGLNNVEVGKTITLTASILPENATNKNVIWSSEDESIATVNNAGIVIGVATGSAIITVTTEEGSKTDDHQVLITKYIEEPETSVDSTVPATFLYDRYTYTTLDIPMTLNGNTLTKINDEAVDLKSGIDYTLAGSTVILLPAYMKARAVGSLSLTFTFSAGATDTCIITINDTSPVRSPLASFAPVTLTQTGDIANSNVQYTNALAVIDALPKKIAVTLEDMSVVNVPVTWIDIDTYDAGSAADYTFTAIWGVMPEGANNANNLPAPTVEVSVTQGVITPVVTVATVTSYLELVNATASAAITDIVIDANIAVPSKGSASWTIDISTKNVIINSNKTLTLEPYSKMVYKTMINKGSIIIQGSAMDGDQGYLQGGNLLGDGVVTGTGGVSIDVNTEDALRNALRFDTQYVDISILIPLSIASDLDLVRANSSISSRRIHFHGTGVLKGVTDGISFKIYNGDLLSQHGATNNFYYADGATKIAEGFFAPENHTFIWNSSKQCWVSDVSYGVNVITLISIGDIGGTARVGSELSPGLVLPIEATFSFQWKICATEDGIYEDIAGADTNIYTPVSSDVGKYIKVVATGAVSQSGVISTGTVTSTSVGPIEGLTVGTVANEALTGTTGNDILNGAVGTHIMTGKAGDDTYLISASGGSIVENVNEGYDTVYASCNYALPDNVEKIITINDNSKDMADETTVPIDSANKDGTTVQAYVLGQSLDWANSLNIVQGYNSLGFTGTCGECSIANAVTMLGICAEENDVVNYAYNNNLCVATGGTTSYQQLAILKGEFGITAIIVKNPTLEAIASYVEKGKAAIINLYDKYLFINPSGTSAYTANHAVCVTGVVKDSSSNLIGIYVANSSITRDGGVQYIDATHLYNACTSSNILLSSLLVLDTDTYGNSLTKIEKDSFSITGNSLDNYIIGNEGDNYIDGGLGFDTMVGGKGNDTYVIDDLGDIVIENSMEGYHDKVITSVSYTLSENVEDVTMTGLVNINVTGNDSNNYIIGNSGSGTISSEGGDDIILTWQNDGSFTIDSGVGDDITSLGTGHNTLLFSLGDGSDEIVGSHKSTDDRIIFDSTVTRSNIAIAYDSSTKNLNIYYGTNSKIVFDLFDTTTTGANSFTIQTSDGYYMNSSDLQNLIKSMTTYYNKYYGTIPISDVDSVRNNSELMTMISNFWHL